MKWLRKLLSAPAAGGQQEPVKQATKARRQEWPDADPIDKTDPFWEFNNNCSVNGTPYKREEVEPGRWQWVADEKIVRLQNEREARRSELWWALRTRPLTPEEANEVRGWGDSINITPMVSYYAEEKSRERILAFEAQARLQMMVAQANLPNHTPAPAQ